MKLTSKEIAELTGGELLAKADIIITGAAGLLEAEASDVSFIRNEKYIKNIPQSKAGLLIIPDKLSVENRPVIKVKNSEIAFAKVLEIIEKEQKPEKTGLHPTAVIAKSAKLGKNVYIGPLVVIEDNAIIGDNTKLIAQCYVGANTKIGSDCLIYPQVAIRENITIGNRVIINMGTAIGTDGFGFTPSKTGLYKIPQVGTVVIEDDVEIGSNVAVDRATTGQTKIGRGTKIDNQIQIAHNVQIGQNCIIVASASIAGSAKIGNNVTIAGQAGVMGHITIGDNVIVGGQAGVISSVEAGEIVSGYPARPHKKAMKIQALMHKLPEMYEEIKKLKGR